MRRQQGPAIDTQTQQAHQHIAVAVHDEGWGFGAGQRVPHPPIIVNELLVRHPLQIQDGERTDQVSLART